MSKIDMSLGNCLTNFLKSISTATNTCRQKSKWSLCLEGFRLKLSSNQAKFQLNGPNPSKQLISAPLQLPPSLFHRVAAENYISV